jgi:hypothetical protein
VNIPKHRFGFIDIERVGIYGHSVGAFMSTAAMPVYPDSFKAAVSSSGNHNNDVYNLNWSEKHDGVKEVVSRQGEITFEFDISKNSDLVMSPKIPARATRRRLPWVSTKRPSPSDREEPAPWRRRR